MRIRFLFRALLLTCVVMVAHQNVVGQFPKKIKDVAKKAAETKGRLPTADSAPPPQPTSTAEPAQPAASADTAPAAGPADPAIWDNYDFVPGNRVLFYTDFSEDKVGNFANRLKYKSGSMDVVERDGVRMLRATSRSELLIPLGQVLPDRFTLELDVIAPATYIQGYDVVAFEGGTDLDRGDNSAEVNWNTSGTLIIGGGQNASTSGVTIPQSMHRLLLGQPTHIRVLMDGDYFKLYVNERRLYNIPVLAFKRDASIRVFLRGSEEPGMALYVARIRAAESEMDVLYEALANGGRWSTQGILFATGKAELQPESRPVLKEIATTLKDHDDLIITIEGHTDNVGSPASNMTLSDARAAAVKDALVNDFDIGADRITTKGLGDTMPAQPNTTPEGRAQNRRVEIVRQ